METFGRNRYFGWILTNLSINSMAAFEIRRHKFQWDNQDLCKGNPHKMGPKNLPLSEP